MTDITISDLEDFYTCPTESYAWFIAMPVGVTDSSKFLELRLMLNTGAKKPYEITGTFTSKSHTYVETFAIGDTSYSDMDEAVEEFIERVNNLQDFTHMQYTLEYHRTN